MSPPAARTRTLIDATATATAATHTWEMSVSEISMGKAIGSGGSGTVSGVSCVLACGHRARHGLDRAAEE